MPTQSVLICAPVIPEFDRESGSRRIFHFIQMMREAGWSVTFYALNATDGQRYIRILQQMGVIVYSGEHSKNAGDDYLPDPKRMIEHAQFDLALLAFWYLAEWLIPIIREKSPQTRIIVDSVDLQFVRQARKVFHQNGDDADRRLDQAFGQIVRRELNAYAAADSVLTVSQREADWVNDLMVDKNHAFSAPDVEDYPYLDRPFAAREGMLFIGNFRHPPNRNAVEYLVMDVLPRIPDAVLARHPLTIVGNALDEAVLDLTGRSPHVIAVGWVPSLLPYLAGCRVSVAPILYGAGTNRKIIEALVTGLPTVTTSIGVDGFPELHHGEHILIADTPQDFASAVVELLDDEAHWTKLSRQGRDGILTSHSPAVVFQRLMTAIETTLNKIPRKEYLP